MKKVLLILLCLPMLIFAQQINSSLVQAACGPQFGPANCHVFTKCVNGVDDLIEKTYDWGGSGFTSPAVLRQIQFIKPEQVL